MPSHNDPLTETGIVADLRRRSFRHGGALAAIQIPQPAKDSLTITTSGQPATWTLTALPYNGTLGSSVNLSLNGQELKEGTDYTVDYSTGIVSFTSGTQALFKSTPTPADVVTADYWTTGDLIAQSQPADQGGYPGEVLQDSPLFYFRLDETSGTLANDHSGNGHNGTYIGSPVLGTTSLLRTDTDKSAYFDAAGKYVTVTNSTAFNTSAITIELWTDVGSSGTRDLYLHPGRCRWTQAGGTATFYVWSGGAWSSVGAATSITPTGTYHVAMTYDGSTLQWYQNGAPFGSPISHAATLPNGTGDVAMGNVNIVFANANALHGDEFAVYGSVLSASRILAHYNAS